jgi:hypothetical protein
MKIFTSIICFLMLGYGYTHASMPDIANIQATVGESQPAPITPTAPNVPSSAESNPVESTMQATVPTVSQQPLINTVPGLSGVPSIPTGSLPVPGVTEQLPAPIDYTQQGQESIKEGIDTIEEEDSGNWYEKRRAWKKAKPKYDEIRKLVTALDDSTAYFFEANKDVEKEIEQFYLAIGSEQMQALTNLNNIMQALAKERETKNEKIAAQEAKQLADMQAQKQKNLEGLKSNLENIKKINENIRNAILGTLVDQVRVARSYEDKALESYYRISEILDDRKAWNLLHDMDVYKENVQAIQDWINSELRNYIDQSSAKAKELIESSKQLVDMLNQQGITLRKQLTAEEKRAHDEKLKQEAEEKARAAEKNKSIWNSIKNFFGSIWLWLKNTIINLFSGTVKQKPEAVVPVKAPVVPAHLPQAAQPARVSTADVMRNAEPLEIESSQHASELTSGYVESAR